MKVLVIEDNKADQRLLQEMFRDMNMPAFELVFAENLTKGIAYLDSEDIGIVILDLGLPESQGLDTFLRLKAHAENVSVIVLTGLDDTSIALKALKEGAQDYLIKGWISTEILKKSIIYAIERQRLIEELRQSNREILFKEERFRTLIEENADAMVVLSEKGVVQYQNPAAELLFEGAPADYLKIHSFFQFEGGKNVERILDFPSGIQKIIEIRGVPIEWERLRTFLLTIRDITERKRMEEALQRKTRAYQVISECNQFMVRTSNEQDLIKGICNILVTLGGYRCAWVGYSHPDKDKTVEPVAQSGFEEDHLKNLKISWKKGRHGIGPTGNTIRTNKPAVIHNIQKNLKCRSWSSDAIKRDYVSVAAFPLIIKEQTIGALTIYASEPEAFDHEEMQLLLEMTGDLAFGIASIRIKIERDQAEDSLRETNEYLSNLLDYANAPIIVWDPKFRITRFNHAFEHMTGRREQEVLGQPLDILFPTESRDASLALIKKTLEGERWETVEIPILTSEGSSKTVLWNSANVLDSRGNLAATIAQGVDITMRKDAEKALKTERQRLYDMLDSMPIMVCLLTPDYHVAFSNQAFREKFGESHGRRCYEYCFGKKEPCDFCETYRVLKTAKPHHWQVTTPDGAGVIDVHDFPFTDADGSPMILEMNIDITERKKAEEEMKRSFERFKTVMDGLDALVYVVDMETYNLLFINKYGIDVWGNIEGKVCWQTIQNDQSGPCPFCTNDRLVDSKGNPTGVYQWEFQNTVTNRWYDCRDSAIRWLDGRFVRLEIATEITRHKQVEDQLKHFNEELEKQVAGRTEALSKSLNEREILFKEVHHRVKNNMQIIISLLNLQSRTIDDPVTLRTIKDSQNRIRAMALVHERLYQSGDISSIDLKDYIQFLARELFSFYGVKSQLIRFTITSPAINVNIDTAIPLGLMVNELISNAIKYAFPEDRRGEIVIDITKDKNDISLVVRDNGVGIPADFDWHNAKSLGIRLVNSLVEQLQGTIELDRTGGTAFTIVVKEKK
jgi:PAS domain S-box-containing protein